MKTCAASVTTASLVLLAVWLPLVAASPTAKRYLAALQAPSQGSKNEHGSRGRRGVVSSEVDVCSNVGADMLAKGGSAADAIIAASLCVGSIDSFHSGIGGGGHILVHHNGHGQHIDMRETLPAAGYPEIFKDHGANSSVLGGLAVGVPGEVRGWEALHKRYGKMQWEQLFQPAVQINYGGFKVPNQLATAIRENEEYVCQGYFKETYCPDGKIAVEGQRITRPRYGKTLATIASKGPSSFYRGSIARNTVQAVNASGGILTLQDLAGYKVVDRKPLSVRFNNHTVYGTAAPSSGGVVLSALQTLDQYSDRAKAGYNLTTHRLIEAAKFAYGERSQYGDPAFVHNVSTLQHEFLNVSWAQTKRHKIKDDGVLPREQYDPTHFEILTDAGTSHLVAIDETGLTVTLTTTINTYFGSKIMTEDGIILNNEMDDFGTPGTTNSYGYLPASANYPAPGKRPLSSISPVIAVDDQGRVVLATGSAGGSHIPTAVLITAYSVLQDGLGIQASLAQPRWHNQLSPATTQLEWAEPADGISASQATGRKQWTGFNNATAEFLKERGHNVTWVAPGSSTAQGAQYLTHQKLYVGGAETRQLAAAAAAI